MTSHRYAQALHMGWMMTQHIGSAPKPLLIVSKKEVGESQPFVCESDADIQWAKSQGALMIVNCCSVGPQNRFGPSTPYPSRHSVWIEANCFIQQAVGQIDFIAVKRQNKCGSRQYQRVFSLHT